MYRDDAGSVEDAVICMSEVELNARERTRG